MRGYRPCVATTVPHRTAFDDVTPEQVESFRRDGFLIVEEGLVSMAAVEVLRERFAAASSTATTPPACSPTR